VVELETRHTANPFAPSRYRSGLTVSLDLLRMKIGICFTNFGPYHLARLRALAARLREKGDRLIAYEVAGRERTYPWTRSAHDEPFTWNTLFPDRVLEAIDPAHCRAAMAQVLDRDHPDGLGLVGYARPESMAGARWANRHGRPAVLLSESHRLDRPRFWWKELIKTRRLRLFNSALVGGPLHRDYLASLGMSPGRVALGYNAVDNDYFVNEARRWRENSSGRSGLPSARYFLSVCRFAPEKNLVRLIRAFARYRQQTAASARWDLVLCGGGPTAAAMDEAVADSGCAHAIHRPGFLQVDALPRWYAHAGAFVLPSLSEPWGLVVNEAAASGLPLLVSTHAGCAPTLVPEPEGTTGSQFDPLDVEEMTTKLAGMAALTDEARCALGRRAAEVVSHWGPDRFAHGFTEALELARVPERPRDFTPHATLRTR
jgi:glycosyltransferase involved in cell wall biosynthesis